MLCGRGVNKKIAMFLFPYPLDKVSLVYFGIFVMGISLTGLKARLRDYARLRAYCLYGLRSVWRHHGLINYVDTEAKYHHLKKLTCKETLRQVFIRVYRVETQSVMLVFSFDPAL